LKFKIFKIFKKPNKNQPYKMDVYLSLRRHISKTHERNNYGFPELHAPDYIGWSDDEFGIIYCSSDDKKILSDFDKKIIQKEEEMIKELTKLATEREEYRASIPERQHPNPQNLGCSIDYRVYTHWGGIGFNDQRLNNHFESIRKRMTPEETAEFEVLWNPRPEKYPVCPPTEGKHNNREIFYFKCKMIAKYQSFVKWFVYED
jgi:hypothetical protein